MINESNENILWYIMFIIIIPEKKNGGKNSSINVIFQKIY